MSGSNHGPVPSRLIFLSDLCSVPVGDKVRFLGCVTEYVTKHAILTLKHAYPLSSLYPNAASVDISLLLTTLKPTVIQIGEWVNVIGYVTASGLSTNKGSSGNTSEDEMRPAVQAILLWSAGPLNLGEYERVVEDRLEAGRRIKVGC